MRRPVVILLVLVALHSVASATPAYESNRSLAGTLRLWGPPSMAPLARLWAAGFAQQQPGVKIEIDFRGSDTAIPGLYSGRADIAILGRENNVTDDNGFSRPMGYKPLRFELTTGSFDSLDKSPALVVFVHRDNPLARLTLAQLDALFGAERRRGAPQALRTWGQLGLGGEWADRPIRLYGHNARSGTGKFFAKQVLLGSNKLNWEQLSEFTDTRRPDGTRCAASEQIFAALSADRAGLAVTDAHFVSADVRAVPLSALDGDEAIAASRETLVSRRYPLTRATYAFVNRPPGTALDPKVREFLRYVFSREGQADIAREKDFLPLNEPTLAAQRQLLE